MVTDFSPVFLFCPFYCSHFTFRSLIWVHFYIEYDGWVKILYFLPSHGVQLFWHCMSGKTLSFFYWVAFIYTFVEINWLYFVGALPQYLDCCNFIDSLEISCISDQVLQLCYSLPSVLEIYIPFPFHYFKKQLIHYLHKTMLEFWSGWINLRRNCILTILTVQNHKQVITPTDFQMLKQLCIARINPIWSWCIVLFIYCWIWITKILLDFWICVHEGYWCSFLVISLPGFISSLT